MIASVRNGSVLVVKGIFSAFCLGLFVAWPVILAVLVGEGFVSFLGWEIFLSLFVAGVFTNMFASKDADDDGNITYQKIMLTWKRVMNFWQQIYIWYFVAFLSALLTGLLFGQQREFFVVCFVIVVVKAAVLVEGKNR